MGRPPAKATVGFGGLGGCKLGSFGLRTFGPSSVARALAVGMGPMLGCLCCTGRAGRAGRDVFSLALALARALPRVLPLALALGCGGGLASHKAPDAADSVLAEPKETGGSARSDSPGTSKASAIPEALRREGRWGRRAVPGMPLSLPLPDEPSWVFDKAPPGQAHGVHRPSGASLWIWEFFEGELVNRSKCEALALQRGYGPVGALRSAHRQVIRAPAEFDTGLWVVLAEGTGAQPWKGGHAFAFAAQRRKCLVLRYDAPASAAHEEASLFADLARMEAFSFPALAVDNPMDGPPRENQPLLRSTPRRDAREAHEGPNPRDRRPGGPSAP